MAAKPAPCRLLLRSKGSVELFTLPDTSSSSTTAGATTPAPKGGTVLHSGRSTFHVLCPGGRRAFVHDPSVGVVRCDLDPSTSDTATATASAPATAFLPGTAAVQLCRPSPLGTYLVTWERPSPTLPENLRVWSAETGSMVKGFSCKKATLNTLQWTHDEELVFHMVTNEIHVHDAATFERTGRVRCQSVTSFSLPERKGLPNNVIPPKEGRYVLTTFAAGAKGKPARVDLIRYPDRAGRESSSTVDGVSVPSGPTLACKTLFNAEEVGVKWSPRADACLALASTAVDATGESYYGSSHLFLFLECDRKDPTKGSVIQVPLPAESTKTEKGIVPIVECGWVPNPTVTGVVPFGVISGRMPALASLHHGQTGDPTFLLGRAHRNTMDVSPHGRFVVCGGYGNLAGGMDFWDRNKGKKIPRHVVLPDSGGGSGDAAASYVTIKDASDLTVTSSSPVVGHQWSPDGRTYVTACTSPRMNVDNGVTLYRYDGSRVDESTLPWDNEKYRPDRLVAAEFVPAPFPEDDSAYYYYDDRPQSPAPRSRYTELKGKDADDALARLQAADAAKARAGGKAPFGPGWGVRATRGAYVPPGARKSGGGGGGGGSYVPPGARAGRGSGSSLAERMRKEREGGAAAVSGVKVQAGRSGPVGSASVVGGEAAPNPDQKSKSAVRREKQRLAKEKADREAEEAERRKAEEEKAKAEANRTDPAKRSKKIKKVLKQIDEIKAKRDGGTELNEDQVAKLATEEELRKELAELGP